MLVTLHLAVHISHELIGENLSSRQPIHNPLNLSHMAVTVKRRVLIVRRYGIEAEQIESQTVRNYHGAHHHLSLTGRIVRLIERIVGAKIFIQTDTQRTVSHNDTLIERADLSGSLRAND